MPSLPFHLEPITTTQYVIMGDVLIGEGSAIAPGVLLQADPGSRIVLGTGVCLGMGCVIHASGGEISIGHGSNLGAGVLVVGATTIGERALVGAGTTVFGQTIAAGALIAPSSLLASELSTINETPIVERPLAEQPPSTQPPSTSIEPDRADKDQLNHERVNVDSNGYFYAKGNSKVKPEVTIEDPWDSEPTSPANLPPIDTETPVVSTFVYPEDNLQPKHAWQTSAQADLGKANPVSSPANPATSAYPTAPQIYTEQSNSAEIPSPQPNPDSDLSAEEMQHGPEDSNHAVGSSELAPREPKQVYGQAYVNQMLGKMLGKKDS